MGIFCQEYTGAAEADRILIGLPYDGTTSNRPGTRFGPAAIREATLNVEDYSPELRRDISELNLHDAGDVELPFGDTAAALVRIQETYASLADHKARIIALGGEHLVTLPLIRVMHRIYGNKLFVVQFDAHADLRTEYLGVEFSHATVMHHVSTIAGPEHTAAVGIRSGSADEWRALQTRPNCFGRFAGRRIDEFPDFVRSLPADTIFYLTIDLDVFDPSLFPGTGTPEPGGLFWHEFMPLLTPFAGRDIAGIDIVELSPHYDHSGVSSAVAATVLRECLLL